ncbi:PilW family protein [Patescibacteria group bacterium]
MRDKKGFSMMEMVVYIAILAIVSILVVSSMLKMMSVYNGYRVSRSINIAGSTAMERITREIRLADNVVSTDSIFETHPGILKLDTIDPVSEVATTIEFFASSTQLMIKEGANPADVLTPPAIELTNLVFREVATSTNLNSKAIKVEVELKGERGNYEKTTKFYNTVILRRSY